MACGRSKGLVVNGLSELRVLQTQFSELSLGHVSERSGERTVGDVCEVLASREN